MRAARSRLWVATNAATRLALTSEVSVSKTWSAVLGSRLPVGSSASKTRGALANAPRVLLADEPTGNLDPKTADHVFDTLTSLVKASRVAALVATHNLDLAARMDRRVTLREGRVVEMG